MNQREYEPRLEMANQSGITNTVPYTVSVKMPVVLSTFVLKQLVVCTLCRRGL